MYEFHPELCESEADDMNDAHLGHSQGFDDIHFEWSAKGATAAQVLQKWIMDRKLTSRVEDLKPSELHGKFSWESWGSCHSCWGYRFMMFHPLFLVAQTLAQGGSRPSGQLGRSFSTAGRASKMSTVLRCKRKRLRKRFLVAVDRSFG